MLLVARNVGMSAMTTAMKSELPMARWLVLYSAVALALLKATKSVLTSEVALVFLKVGMSEMSTAVKSDHPMARRLVLSSSDAT